MARTRRQVVEPTPTEIEIERLDKRLTTIREAIQSRLEDDVSSLSASGRSLVHLSMDVLYRMEKETEMQLQQLKDPKFPFNRRIKYEYAGNSL